MDVKKLSIYFFVPLGVVLPMIAMYFSGNDTLQHIISPDIENLYGGSNRELGLLENLQNVVLLALLFCILIAFRRPRTTLEKVVLVGMLAASVFIFMEELDYGRHYYEYFAGIQTEDALQERNWHNVGERTLRTKQVVDVAMVLFFVIGPFALARSTNVYVQFIRPDRYIALTMLATFIVRMTAHTASDMGLGKPGTIDSNLSEFCELVTYYVIFLYFFEQLLRRSLFPASPEENRASAEPA